MGEFAPLGCFCQSVLLSVLGTFDYLNLFNFQNMFIVFSTFIVLCIVILMHKFPYQKRASSRSGSSASC